MQMLLDLELGRAMQKAFGTTSSKAARRLAAAMTLASTLLFAPGQAGSAEFNIELVTPGMNQTELQSVLGPPDYIQVKYLRTAWQYCPRRFFIRFLDPYVREYVREEAPLFVTVWFDNGRVVHMRAYPGERMGECEDFLAAFRWEDDIGGGMVEFEGGRRIK
jgi:hypothetical protein